MHDPTTCACSACVMVRAWLQSQTTGAIHPECCACPLCAEAREWERRAYDRAVSASVGQDGTYASATTNDWWKHQTDNPGAHLNLVWNGTPAGHKDPDNFVPKSPVDALYRKANDRVAVDALLIDMGIKQRKED